MIIENFLSICETALRAGNSKAISWYDYLYFVDATEVCSFLKITPKRS